MNAGECGLRVLHVGGGELYGGVESMLTALARAGASHGSLRQDYALVRNGRVGHELEAAGARTCRFGPARLSRPWTIWSARGRLKTLAQRQAYAAAYCHGPWAHVVAGPALQASGVPTVLWLHAPPLDGWLERWSRRIGADALVCNSRYTAAAAERFFGSPFAQVIHPAVRLPDEASLRATRGTVREELATAPDAIVIVHVSRMEAWKGHETLLEALARLATLEGWCCWIVGGAQRPAEVRYRDALRARAADLGLTGRVSFAGERTDVDRILRAADIFCQPNVQPEPFGLSFLEAMAAGLPVIGSASGATLEIIDDSCGRLVPSGDVSALAAVLRDLMDDPELRRSLGAGGPARARSLCDPAARLEQCRALAAALRAEAAA